ncbi:MAG: hypothetical protein IPN47_13010 [Gemmatimonadetes bacterium]|nr:hypothetical protein [Gemmatimonadota bacterium]
MRAARPPSLPVLIGSGLTPENAATLAPLCDGAIVGTSLPSGRPHRDRVVLGAGDASGARGTCRALDTHGVSETPPTTSAERVSLKRLTRGSRPLSRSSQATCSARGLLHPGELAMIAQHQWPGALHLGAVRCHYALWCPHAGRDVPHAPRTQGDVPRPQGGSARSGDSSWVWLELWVSGPGAVARIAIVFSEFMQRVVVNVGDRAGVVGHVQRHRLLCGNQPGRGDVGWARAGDW